MDAVKMLRWNAPETPTRSVIEKRLRAEGLDYYAWGNGPQDVYPAHSHPYHKVIYVVQGSIRFGLPQTGESLMLEAGDRLELPAGTLHNAVVGDSGVECYEAHC